MSQIAQQDHLFIEVGHTAMDELNVDPVKSQIWPILEEKFKAGTLQDCIIRNDYGEFAKILSCTVDWETKELTEVSVTFEMSVIGIYNV